MDKREFIKYGILGFCGFVCNLRRTFSIPGVLLSELNSSEKLWKWSKEGLFYSVTPKGVKCLICPNECTIKENETGDCRNRINYEGKLYSIAYGNPCAVHVDPIEKKPLYHFLPNAKAYSIATAGCNLACLNCQNWEISQTSPKETRNYDLMPEKVVEQAILNKCETIAYTYSDPISFYEYTIDTSKIAQEKGIKNLIVTAGYINEEPLRNLCKYIDAANVDLKSFSNDIYMKLNGGTLQPVLNTLKIIAEENVWLEITNLIVPGWTDDLAMIKKMCEWLCNNGLSNYPLHFSRFHPSYKLTQLPSTPIYTLEKAKEIALNAGIKYVYIGNVPGSDAQNTNCPQCNKVLIERKGYSILQNNIQDNKCKYCKTKIPGVWN
ncbi:MAG: AmmeMemoRadiSam system radical SAM enzyme [Bacteroidales bacterium]|nr:AmmeMemoRadiSam system radical SAM enzyme [Bacteroidales bacterium]